MKDQIRMADCDHPMVQKKAAEVTLGRTAPLEKMNGIFHFVRDEIRFGFTPKWDQVKASEVMRYGLGYCNTKATLLLALCHASGIPARVHFGLIDIRIMRGILPSFAFPFMPKVAAIRGSRCDSKLSGDLSIRTSTIGHFTSGHSSG